MKNNWREMENARAKRDAVSATPSASPWQKINRTKVPKPADRRQCKCEQKCWVFFPKKVFGLSLSDEWWWSVECCAGVAPVVSVQTPIRLGLLFPISHFRDYTKNNIRKPAWPKHMHLKMDDTLPFHNVQIKSGLNGTMIFQQKSVQCPVICHFLFQR